MSDFSQSKHCLILCNFFLEIAFKDFDITLMGN